MKKQRIMALHIKIFNSIEINCIHNLFFKFDKTSDKHLKGQRSIEMGDVILNL